MYGRLTCQGLEFSDAAFRSGSQACDRCLDEGHGGFKIVCCWDCGADIATTVHK